MSRRSLRRSGAQGGEGAYWPGFVDAMAQLLLVVVFLLSVFVLAQFLLAREVLDRDTVLGKLKEQVSSLSHLLSMEQAEKESLTRKMAVMERSQKNPRSEDVQHDQDLMTQKKISLEALAEVETLTQQVSALRRQLHFVQSALGRIQTQDSEVKGQLDAFGQRLNIALAQRVKELESYRSEFFGRLRDLLSKRSDIRILGDRFIFQSEILFPPASGELTEEGKNQLITLVGAIKDLEGALPSDIPWILEIGGHTDRDPIKSPFFASNWELSMARALAVVHFMIAQGVPPHRLVAAGFGEFQPIDPGKSAEQKARNRRIEFKLTQR